MIPNPLYLLNISTKTDNTHWVNTKSIKQTPTTLSGYFRDELGWVKFIMGFLISKLTHLKLSFLLLRNPTKSVRIRPNPSKSVQIRPNPSKSDQIRPNPTKSVQIRRTDSDGVTPGGGPLYSPWLKKIFNSVLLECSRMLNSINARNTN